MRRAPTAMQSIETIVPTVPKRFGRIASHSWLGNAARMWNAKERWRLCALLGRQCLQDMSRVLWFRRIYNGIPIAMTMSVLVCVCVCARASACMRQSARRTCIASSSMARRGRMILLAVYRDAVILKMLPMRRRRRLIEIHWRNTEYQLWTVPRRTDLWLASAFQLSSAAHKCQW